MALSLKLCATITPCSAPSPWSALQQVFSAQVCLGPARLFQDDPEGSKGNEYKTSSLGLGTSQQLGHSELTTLGVLTHGSNCCHLFFSSYRKTVLLDTSCWLNWSKRKNKLKAEASGR